MLRNMPIVVIREIFKLLNPTDLLNSALCSFELTRIILRLLPKVRSMKVRITNDELKGSYDGDELVISILHISRKETEKILNLLIPEFAKVLESLSLENELINGYISDEELARVFQLTKNAPLRQLELSGIDLERINTWTLALIAGFDKLERIEIEECNLRGNTEMKLLRCLQSSFQTLTQIDLKGTHHITDHFARRVSRSCPYLAYFRISDCPRVTTLSALPLIESVEFRRTDKLDVYMSNTEFDANQLQNFMRSPLFGSQISEWNLNHVIVPFGIEKPAILAFHSSRKCVCIFV